MRRQCTCYLAQLQKETEFDAAFAASGNGWRRKFQQSLLAYPLMLNDSCVFGAEAAGDSTNICAPKNASWTNIEKVAIHLQSTLDRSFHLVLSMIPSRVLLPISGKISDIDNISEQIVNRFASNSKVTLPGRRICCRRVGTRQLQKIYG